MTKVNIKGQDYEVFRDDLNNRQLAENDGICDLYDKKIIIREIQYLDGDSDRAKKYREEHVVRHELIHALAEECGVSYGENEDLVDWIAAIIPHVNKAVDQLRKDGVI